MKKIISTFLLSILLSVSALAQGVHTDAYLKNLMDSLIRRQTLIKENVAKVFQTTFDSKVSKLGSEFVWATNQTIVLPSGAWYGKYKNGDVAPWAGMNLMQSTYDAIHAYLVPTFNSFTVNQATPVEVGFTIPTSLTATWSINVGTGVVSTIDIFDNTGVSTLLSNTPNDGTQAFTAVALQLNSNGATQSWKGIAHDTGTQPSNINSGNYVVQARFYRFFGPVSASPTNSATVRAISAGTFHTGATTFTFSTGTSLTKFVVALPPGVTIASAKNLDTNIDITANFILTGTINVLDAGSTNRAYNIYEANVALAFSPANTIQIVTAN